MRYDDGEVSDTRSTPHPIPPAVAPQSFALLRERLKSGKTTLSEELTELLQRIQSHEPVVAALLPDETASQRRTRLLEEAAELEQRWPEPSQRPPLFGALVGVKDLFHAVGFPTRGGSLLPPEVFAGEDAPGRPEPHTGEASTVAALRAAGALVLGKTVTTEFAYFGPGPTRNPWNPSHTPGGSSSGSAAAVAAGFCHIALGTQTIGSISRPASFCGVAGFKPSFGRIAADGVIPFSASADHVGVIAADLASLTLAASVLVQRWSPAAVQSAATASATATQHPPVIAAAAGRSFGTVAMPEGRYLHQADSASLRALDMVIDRLHNSGVDIQRVSVLSDIERINQLHRDMIARDFSDVHASWYRDYGDRYQSTSARLIEQGATVSDDRRDAARAQRIEVRHKLEHELERHGADFWLAPATVGEAPHGIESTGSPIMNLPWTYAGLPTVSLSLATLPEGRGPAGLPLGIQIASRHGSDEELLSCATQLEAQLLQ